MTANDLSMLMLLMPVLLMAMISLRILIRSDQEEIRSQKLDHIPVSIENQKGKKDHQ